MLEPTPIAARATPRLKIPARRPLTAGGTCGHGVARSRGATGHGGHALCRERQLDPGSTPSDCQAPGRTQADALRDTYPGLLGDGGEDRPRGGIELWLEATLGVDYLAEL